MKSIVERLKSYFDSTSNEEIQRTWDSTEEFDYINSPSVKVFLDSASCINNTDLTPPPEEFEIENFINNLKSPNFTSDFFYSKYLWNQQNSHSTSLYLTK